MEVDTDEDEKTLNVETITMNLENVEEPMNNDAKICDPAVRDIFHIFANMLDAKSFMKLAMTSKEMYKRCMTDRAIKINVHESSIKVYGDAGGVGFSLRSSFVSERNLRSYVATLRKQRFSLNISELRIDGTPDANNPIVNAARNYLKDIGVNRIVSLEIHRDVPDWEAIIPFIKEFCVNVLLLGDLPIPPPILKHLIQLDLDEIRYDGPITIDFLLEVDSPIRKISLAGIEELTWDELIQLLWKIQSGTLHHLYLDLCIVNQGNHLNVQRLNCDEEEHPLPNGRPLIFERLWDYTPSEEEYYILHWQGGVTKCVYYNADYGFLEIFKCPPNEFPPILRKDEDVLKDLTQMVPKVSCYERQFDTFVERFTLIEPSFEGPLPPERPLYFKTSNGFWQLNEDYQLMRCYWNNTQATWEPFRPGVSFPIDHPFLRKLMFCKLLEDPTRKDLYLHCKSKEDFDFLMDKYRKLDFEHSAPLPKERPLIFEKTSSDDGNKKFCVILFEDRVLQCELLNDRVVVAFCKSRNRPPILIDEKDVVEILQDPNPARIRVNQETFLNGFQLFKNSKCRPLTFEKTQNIDGKKIEERWFINTNGLFKIVWEDGYASLSDGDHHEVPFEFMKEIFLHCAQTNDMTLDIAMTSEQFESCLELFETRLFNYRGRLHKDRTLAFVKKEIRHICKDGQKTKKNKHCGCSEVFSRVWFLSDGVNISYCTWGEKIPQRLVFTSYRRDLPPLLKGRAYLKNLIELHEPQNAYWYGSFDNYLGFFKDYKKISLSHEGPLPEERPLLVEQDTNGKYKRYLLRDDGRIIQCQWNMSIVIIKTIHPFAGSIPSVLMSVWQ